MVSIGNRRAVLFPILISARADSNVRFAVFSLGVFTEELEEYASETGTLLIGSGKLLGDDDPDVIRKRKPSGAHNGAPY